MFLLINNIDFKSRKLFLEVIDYSKNDDRVLRRYLARCVILGYARFHICYPQGCPKNKLSLLRRLAGDFDVTLSTKKPDDRPKWSSPFSTVLSLRCAPSSTKSSPRLNFVEYTLSGFPAEHMLRCIKDLVVLIGLSIPLEHRLISRLRLGIYELAANSIEHGNFLNVSPQIETCIGIDTDMVEVAYKDNAAFFHTADHKPASIAKHIEQSRKRGLGLSLISELSKELRFERVASWNCTTFILDRHELRAKTRRRKKMEEFSIELVPYDAKDTLVLRPKGSLDSVSAPLLERQLNNAINNDLYRIVIDFSQTDFVSSAGLGLILGTVSTLRAHGGDMILMKIPQGLMDTFELMSVEDYFPIIDTLDDLGVHER